MPESPCLCGFTTVRKGSRVIGRLQFWSGIFVSLVYVITVLLLLIMITTNNHKLDEFKQVLRKEFPQMADPAGIYDLLFNGYTLITTVTSIYAGDILIKATINHNLQFIKTWLKINAIVFIMGIVVYIIPMIVQPSSETVLNFLLVIAISAYFWSVVYQFYKDEKPAAF